MNERPRVLVLNGSLSEIPLIEEAHKLGYYVITTGNAPTLIGHPYADEYIGCDYSDKDAILDLVRNHNIEGIISCANDFGALTASYVAEKMGWPGHDSYEAALVLHRKDLIKKFYAENDIRSPASVRFTDEKSAVEYARTAEYPLIVKATDLTGGKGINRADNFEQAQKAIRIAFDASRVKHIVIEAFIVGQQETMVGFIANQKVVCTIASNCYSPINPYLIQSEIMPSDHYETVKEELTGVMEKISRVLNLADGVITLQYLVKDGVPYIFEMQKRCLGNQFLTTATAATGFPWHEGLVRAELGLDCTGLKAGKPLAKNVGHHGIMARRNGVVKRVTIPEEIKKHTFKSYELLKSGQKLENYMAERVGYIYLSYDDRQEIVNTVKCLNDRITVEFED